MTASLVDGVDLAPLLAFLPCPTPDAWVVEAARPQNEHMLLVDHANCEKKAASSALNLMYRYVEHPRLLHKLSRLAREELRHFEQVLSLLEKRGYSYPQLSAGRYAAGLRELVTRDEPLRLVDTLLVGALIEARSCERFASLLPVLDDELAGFYGSLLKSEARHFKDYLKLAQTIAQGKAQGQGVDIDVEARLGVFKAREAELVTSPDPVFRFHSGVPVAQ